LTRLLVQDEEPTSQDILDTDIDRNGRISIHKTLQVNYTTYDLQRQSDVINIRTRPDIMVVSPEDDHSHPYQYGRVIDIFTVPIHYKGNKEIKGGSPRQDVQVLWVRWFEVVHHEYKDGFSSLRLPRLEFLEPGEDDPEDSWHGFIPPSDVLRATHIIPAFGWGIMEDQFCSEGSHALRYFKEDWCYYYTNM
jgi:hypothetical protein